MRLWQFRVFEDYGGWFDFGDPVEADTQPDERAVGFRPCYDCQDWDWFEVESAAVAQKGD